MAMVPDAAKMHFRNSDQQNSSGGGPRPPHGLRNFGARRVGLHTTWSAPPKPKILATPLLTRSILAITRSIVSYRIGVSDAGFRLCVLFFVTSQSVHWENYLLRPTWRGAFTCVGWQVTLCDPIRQVTLRSSVTGFQPVKSYTVRTFLLTLRFPVPVISHVTTDILTTPEFINV